MDCSRTMGTGGSRSYRRRLLDILSYSAKLRLGRDIGYQHLFQLNNPVLQ